jgi:hypothetical protein
MAEVWKDSGIKNKRNYKKLYWRSFWEKKKSLNNEISDLNIHFILFRIKYTITFVWKIQLEYGYDK